MPTTVNFPSISFAGIKVNLATGLPVGTLAKMRVAPVIGNGTNGGTTSQYALPNPTEMGEDGGSLLLEAYVTAHATATLDSAPVGVPIDCNIVGTPALGPVTGGIPAFLEIDFSVGEQPLSFYKITYDTALPATWFNF